MVPIASIIAAIASVLAAIASIIGVSRKRKIDRLSCDLEDAKGGLSAARNELYRAYVNINELLQIEEDLTSKLGISKISARQGHKTNRYIQPKYVKERIEYLKQKR